VVTAQDRRDSTAGDPSVAGIAIAPRVYGRPFCARSAAVALCLAGIAGAIVSRGSAYPGRFSIHVVPLGVSITTITAARIVRMRTWRP
jgi:hypothetical protein